MNRRGRPRGGPTVSQSPHGPILHGPYDHDLVLAELRRNRALAAGPAHAATVALADIFARTLAEELRDIPEETIGTVLLCVASKMAAMACEGLRQDLMVNTAAFAADVLLPDDPGAGGAPPAGDDTEGSRR